MELRQMRSVVMVAQHENFRHAADHLPISQSALSQQIKKLEEELGEPLFERHSSGVTLTDSGRKFVRKAQEVLELADDARASVQETGETVSGHLTIGLIPSVHTGFVTALLDDVQSEERDVRLTVREGQPEYLLNQLDLGNIDHLLLSEGMDGPDLSITELGDERFRLVVPDGWSLSDRSSLSLEDLDDRSMLLLEEGHSARRQILSLFKNANPDPDLVYRGSSLDSLLEFVAEGHGFSILPELLVESTTRSVVSPELVETVPERTLLLAQRGSRQGHALDEWFLSTTGQWFTDRLESPKD